MEMETIRSFFDRRAETWDETLQHDSTLIGEILDHAGVGAGQHVLDVACGTGVLFPDYQARQVTSLTAIDLSPEMARRAQAKWPEAQVLCGDAGTTNFDRVFDAIVIYNAFPHFAQPEQLLANLKKYVRPGGTVTVAHGMSRAALQAHHARCAQQVSLELPEIDTLAKLFARYFTVEYTISDDSRYQIVGRREK